MKYFFHIGYEGTDYKGWQRQPAVPSVQETIELTLAKIFKEKITVLGCGRTDAGVHASQYVFHIEINITFDFDLKFRLNKNLPDDIAVFDIMPMDDKQHARYDAVSRTYDYFIHLYKDPVLTKYSSYYEFENLDFDAMKSAASLLVTYEDFRAVCKQPKLYRHTLCTVTNAKLYVDADQQRLRFTITANRFLRGMVRLCVYFILKVGTRELTIEEFDKIMTERIELTDNRPVYPNGLYLSRIEYPYLKINQRVDMCSFLKKGLGD